MLLAHWPFVRALARRLVHESDADDVAQETMLTALERPPRAGGSLRGWLAAVARNVARQGWRSDARRQRREDAVRVVDATLSTAAIVERESQRRLVADAVIALAEPYRAAVVLRYFEGLKPGAIAERLGIPVETVRTRLKRAVAELREQLDARHDGDRAAWTTALLPLAGAEPAATAAAGATAGAATVATAAGIGLMQGGLKIGLGALALTIAAGGYWAFDGFGSGGGGWSGDTAPALAPLPAGRGEDAAASGGAPPAEPLPRTPAYAPDAAPGRPAETERAAPKPETATPPAAGPRELVVGVVRGLPQGVARGWVIVSGTYEDLDGETDIPGPRRVALDAAGRYTAPLDWLRQYPEALATIVITPSIPGAAGEAAEYEVDFQVADTGAPRIYETEVHVDSAATVTGRLVDAEGKPIVQHNVSLNDWTGEAPGERSLLTGKTDDDGRFRLAAKDGGEYVVGAAPHRLRHFLPIARRTVLELGKEVDLGEVRAGRGASIEGRVTLPDGTPPVRGWVSATPVEPKGTKFRFGYTTLRWHEDAAHLYYPGADVEADGTFNLRGIRPGRYTLRSDHHVLGFEAPAKEVTAPAHGVALVHPAVRVIVEVFAGDTPFFLAHSHFRFRRKVGDRVGTRSMPVLEPGPVVLEFAPGESGTFSYEVKGFAPWSRRLTAPDAGESLTVRIDLQPDDGRGVVELAPAGPAAAGARSIHVATPDGDHPDWSGEEFDVTDGVVRIPSIKPGHWRIFLHPGSKGIREAYWCGCWIELDVEAGATTRRAIRLTPGGRFRFRAADEAGNPLFGQAALHDATGRARVLHLWSRHGSAHGFAAGPAPFGRNGWTSARGAFPPGRYRLTITSEGFAPQTREFDLAAGKTTDLEFTLVKE
ncbi:MAG: sigma-70 family RNA polymerase sigma factor [Planctomycetota bacterium]